MRSFKALLLTCVLTCTAWLPTHVAARDQGAASAAAESVMASGERAGAEQIVASLVFFMQMGSTGDMGGQPIAATGSEGRGAAGMDYPAHIRRAQACVEPIGIDK